MNRQRITEYLESNGFKHSTKGFHYLTLAIEMASEAGVYTYIEPIKESIAVRCGDTKDRVDRAMRYAIHKSGSKDTIKEFVLKAVWELRYADM